MWGKVFFSVLCFSLARNKLYNGGYFYCSFLCSRSILWAERMFKIFPFALLLQPQCTEHIQFCVNAFPFPLRHSRTEQIAPLLFFPFQSLFHPNPGNLNMCGSSFKKQTRLNNKHTCLFEYKGYLVLPDPSVAPGQLKGRTKSPAVHLYLSCTGDKPSASFCHLMRSKYICILPPGKNKCFVGWSLWQLWLGVGDCDCSV